MNIIYMAHKKRGRNNNKNNNKTYSAAASYLAKREEESSESKTSDGNNVSLEKKHIADASDANAAAVAAAVATLDAANDDAPSPKPEDESSPPESAPPAPSSPPPPELINSPPPPPSIPPPSPPAVLPPPSPPSPSPPPPLAAASPPPPSSSPPPSVPTVNNSSPPPPQNRSPPPSPPHFQAPPPSDESPSSSPPPPSSSSSSRNAPPQIDSTPETSKNNNHKSPLSSVPPPPVTKHGGGGGGSHAKSSGESSSREGSSDAENPGKYVGYTLAGVFVVLLFAVAFFYTYRRKRSKVDPYVASYIPPPDINIHQKPGIDGLIYAQQPQSPHGNNYGNGSMKHIGEEGSSLEAAQPKGAQIVFSYETVMEITNAFSSENLIGQGGFGCVYKGWLPDGRAVAVKQLKAGSGQGDREFKAEVEIISLVHHRHLVSLVGYCISQEQRVLIYEFVPNGTLHHHLHGSGMPPLDWDKRLRIAIGAAKGLAYLHEDCSQKIIHRDIKSANILLDDAFEAQVADFGLARLADASNTHVSTRVMGTFGYMAPEYATSGKLTDRSDVFSFGVVLLELVTGRKPVDETQPLGDESLVEWARPLLIRAMDTRDISELIDPRLEKHFVESEMYRMIEAAAACVRHSAPKRPRMVQVVRALDSGDEISDLTNGVYIGHSTVYDSGQYDKDIMLFRRMANGSYVDSDVDKYSREYRYSRESSGFQQSWMPSGSSGESESKAINNRHGSSTE